jgi:hypothetical protein
MHLCHHLLSHLHACNWQLSSCVHTFESLCETDGIVLSEEEASSLQTNNQQQGTIDVCGNLWCFMFYLMSWVFSAGDVVPQFWLALLFTYAPFLNGVED